MDKAFLLMGNGPYLNHGCEAIIRGTREILKGRFGGVDMHCLDFVSDMGELSQEERLEDGVITHTSVYEVLGAKRGLADRLLNRLVPLENRAPWYQFDAWKHKALREKIQQSDVVLSAGGDNFTLDYGRPEFFRLWHDAFLRMRKPVVLWGASVGPFTGDPVYERRAADHLRRLSAIMAREDNTLNYLDSIGVRDNVHRTADPAFVMQPVRPPDLDIPQGEYIGLNFSPLFALYTEPAGAYRAYCLSLIRALAGQEHKLCLIPHVTQDVNNNDFLFMQSLLDDLPDLKDSVMLLTPAYSAQELKWIISRMTIFIGARTHATIAAFSTGVPVLCLSYSIKSTGLSNDIYGHTDYCVSSKALSLEQTLAIADELIARRAELSAVQFKRVEAFQGMARAAADVLAKL